MGRRCTVLPARSYPLLCLWATTLRATPPTLPTPLVPFRYRAPALAVALTSLLLCRRRVGGEGGGCGIRTPFVSPCLPADLCWAVRFVELWPPGAVPCGALLHRWYPVPVPRFVACSLRLLSEASHASPPCVRFVGAHAAHVRGAALVVLSRIGIGCIGPHTAAHACAGGRYGSSEGLSGPACSGECAAGYFCPAGSASALEHKCSGPTAFCPRGSSRQQVRGWRSDPAPRLPPVCVTCVSMCVSSMCVSVSVCSFRVWSCAQMLQFVHEGLPIDASGGTGGHYSALELDAPSDHTQLKQVGSWHTQMKGRRTTCHPAVFEALAMTEAMSTFASQVRKPTDEVSSVCLL